MSALHKQQGGTHYIECAIQPVEFIYANKLNYLQGCIIKYVVRYQHKNGIDDLRKARHFIDLLEELEYGRADEASDTEDSGARGDG